MMQFNRPNSPFNGQSSQPLQVTSKPMMNQTYAPPAEVNQAQMPQQRPQFGVGGYADQGQPQLPPNAMSGAINQGAQHFNIQDMMRQMPQQGMPQQGMPQGNAMMMARLLRR
jgi:hypothetical protein